VLNQHYVGQVPYFDAAGFVGRTVGLQSAINKKKK